MHDLSASGAGVEAVDLDIECGDRVLFRFDGVVSSEHFQLHATVVRAAPSAARTMYGLKFDRLVDRQVEQLYALVMTFARLRQSNAS